MSNWRTTKWQMINTSFNDIIKEPIHYILCNLWKETFIDQKKVKSVSIIKLNIIFTYIMNKIGNNKYCS